MTDKITFWKMFGVADDALARYRNIIGIGVLAMLICFSFVFMHSIKEQRKIAESCGFDDGKLKCICTESEWKQKMENNFTIILNNLEKIPETINLNSNNS